MIRISVSLGEGYDVNIGQGILSSIGDAARRLFPKGHTVAVVTDDNVKELYLEPVLNALTISGFRPLSYSILPGEASKSTDTYFALLNWLASNHLTRSDIIIALGGGVVGDLAGFAAATYLRGISYIQIPTTLLAMVDSSVGGKTGIDLESGKNLAGAFHQPSFVLCDINMLNTLPINIFNDGMAEVIKYGMLCGPKLLNQLLDSPPKDKLEQIIAECITIKRNIIQKDEFDTGERKLLNFGHTIGHAIELLSDYQISHGAAVSIGMAIITRAALMQKLCPHECLNVLTKLLSSFELPIKTNYNAKELYNAALSDKKRQGAFITIIVPTAFGKCELKTIPVEALLNWIEMGLEPFEPSF
ncbi:MAG: 3-dehydroquinate synthase [Defluviitaleaceae bacterium]|nr:3-dehydroquinate synthase [Defluviitaleaceae bacterium]